jgi:hypothetical protein
VTAAVRSRRRLVTRSPLDRRSIRVDPARSRVTIMPRFRRDECFGGGTRGAAPVERSVPRSADPIGTDVVHQSRVGVVDDQRRTGVERADQWHTSRSASARDDGGQVADRGAEERGARGSTEQEDRTVDARVLLDAAIAFGDVVILGSAGGSNTTVIQARSGPTHVPVESRSSGTLFSTGGARGTVRESTAPDPGLRVHGRTNGRLTHDRERDPR